MTPITSMSQYYTTLAEIETFLAKGFDNLTDDENKKLEELSIAAEAFEEKKYPMPLEITLPAMLEYIMSVKQINKDQLSKALGVPNSTISGLISGKKKLNIEIAKKLHEKFEVDGNLLLKTA